jgi:hypothetical protein
MKKKSKSKPIKQSVFFLQCWFFFGFVVAFFTLITTPTGEDVIFAVIGNVIVMGGLLAAVPTAILGSIRKSREDKQTGSGPPSA